MKDWISLVQPVNCIQWEDPKDTSFAKALNGAPLSFTSSLVTLLCRPSVLVEDTTTAMGSLSSVSEMGSRQVNTSTVKGNKDHQAIWFLGLQRYLSMGNWSQSPYIWSRWATYSSIAWSISFLTSCLVIPSKIESRVWKSPNIIAELSISFLNSVSFYFMHFGALLLDT